MDQYLHKYQQKCKTFPLKVLMDNFNLLKDKALPLTERELSILSVATTELQNKGYDPFNEPLIIQVEPRLTWKFFLLCCKNAMHWLNRSKLNNLIIHPSLFHTEDQNFARSTYLRSNPRISPCIIPHGKYIVTGRWSLLGGQDGNTKWVSLVI